MIYSECITVAQLQEVLKTCSPDAKITLFSSGDTYPALAIQKIYSEDGVINEIELGGGWVSIDYGTVETELLSIDLYPLE